MDSKYDVVYILRNNIASVSELTYSLRTLDNLEYNCVWFAGGQHETLKPDRQLEIIQQGDSKWQRVSYTLRSICECDDITDSFYLFNDDFFILRPVDSIPPIYNGDLQSRVKEISRRHSGRSSGYSRQLEQTMNELKRRNLPTLNYAVHVPILIDRKKALEVLDAFDGFPMFRCLYGNYWNIGGQDHKDVKIATKDKVPNEEWEFVSTSDDSFKHGSVGMFIRKRFKTKSRFEL